MVIPTRNRKDLLRETIVAAQRQTVPVEIIVVDEGTDDGKREMVTGEFPQIRYRRFEGPNGPAFIRNRGSEMARAPILFPIDDDAVMVSPETVARTMEDFSDLQVGAVGIPFINVNRNDAVRQRAPMGKIPPVIIEAYVGASHAVRRDLFLRLGGYREHLFYMGEEGDYCIRMLAAGFFVRMGSAPPIHHYESARRATWRMDYYGRRNDVLFAWHNVPATNLTLHLAGTVFNGLRAAVGAHHPRMMILGLAAGLAGIVRYWKNRRAVSRDVYRTSRLLKKGGAISLAELRSSGIQPLPGREDGPHVHEGRQHR